MARAFGPDLIVTDYKMPGLDGLAAAAQVNRERPVPVVLVSGRQDVDLAATAGDLRVVRVLAKPVKEADLRAAVEAVATEAIAPRGLTPARQVLPIGSRPEFDR